ncbi:hypothetical protein [Aureivirga marina]|uniref:hypothetical protein n=1 Tax=Aureivirga marina TaxID=1182451 RepID=UPI0018CBDC39|nr:hypothetical protein [Aureivirga marina]
MKKILFFTILFLQSLFIFSQKNDTIQRTYYNIKDLKEKVKENKIEELKYANKNFNYEVIIPKWLTLKETGDSNIIGGIMPKVDGEVKGIYNAVSIQEFSKSSFKSFEEFKHTYSTGNSFGQKTLFSDSHIWYGQKDIIEIDNGIKQKVFIFWQNNIYHHQFVLLKTKTAYLFIQFVATPKTYDINIGKFEEFLKGLTIYK